MTRDLRGPMGGTVGPRGFGSPRLKVGANGSPWEGTTCVAPMASLCNRPSTSRRKSGNAHADACAVLLAYA